MSQVKKPDPVVKKQTGKGDALVSALLSALVPGLGQFRNRQRSKGLVIFLVFVAAIAVELMTSDYFTMSAWLQRYPLQEGEKLHLFRDFGGFFTYGLWGLFTLGVFTRGQSYRGLTMETYSRNIRFRNADNSVTLLGNGLITLMFFAFLLMIYIINIRDAYKVRLAHNNGEEILTGKRMLVDLWDRSLPYFLMAPLAVALGFFSIVPILFSFLLAFTNYTYRIQVPSNLIKWVGFSNFTTFMGDPGWLKIFGQVFLWTVIFAIMASFTCYVLGMINALVIESKTVKAKKLWRTILILPWAIPGMISLMVFKNAFDTNGLFNKILHATDTMEPVSTFLYNIGLQGRPDATIYWFSQPYNGNLAKAVIVIVNLWLGAPYFMMLITGTLTTLPADLYEAASIDGASGSQKFRYLTLPLILRSTAPAIIMTFTHNFNNFGSIYFLTGGGPDWVLKDVPLSLRIMGGAPGQTDILISWIYKLSFSANAQLYNVASVYSIFIFILISVFSVVNLSRQKSLWEDF